MNNLCSSSRGVAANAKTPLDAWQHCLVDENAVKIITNHTNKEIKCRISTHKEKNIRIQAYHSECYKNEILVLFGLLYINWFTEGFQVEY